MKNITLFFLIVTAVYITSLVTNSHAIPPTAPQGPAAAINVENDAYSSGWNGDVSNAATQNAIYDYLIQLDTDADGDIDSVDPAASAGDMTKATYDTNADNEVDSAALATTVTVTDDESTNDNQEIVFTTDNLNLESDGDLYYNPSTGLLTVGGGLDGVGAVDMDYGSVDITDHTFTTDDSTVIIDGGITISTGDTLTVGAVQWDNGSDAIDGEVIADDTIDDDSIDFGDVTCADITMSDCAAGIDLGTSQAITGTTAITIGDNNQTVAINSSDWDIDATGAITGVGNITSDGTITAGVGFDCAGDVDCDYGSADIDDHTFITDGTGDAEIVLPNDAIGPDEIDSTTGAYDFGGVTSFEIPNAAAPATDAAGEIALDTTIVSHNPLIQYYDGAQNMTVIAIPTTDLTADDNYIIKYDLANTKFTMEADATAATTPGFDDSADPVVQSTTTSDVHIGDAAGTLAGKLEIGGDDDQPQLVIEGHSTQTDSIVVIQQDNDTEVATVDNSGLISTLVGIDAIGAVDFDIGSADVVDITLLEGGNSYVFDDGLTIPTTTKIQVGAVRWDNTADAIDGEVIADDTIDDDSIDFGDVTCVDITTTDCGAITSTGVITATTSVITPLLDAAGAEDMDYGSADVTDHTFTTNDSTFIIDGGITVSTGDTITLGATAWNSGDNIDGEVIANDTIDDDSIDFGDVTCVDITMTDCGNITTTGTLDISGGTLTNAAGALTNDTLLEADLKAVNAATDEYALTYESTTGDFEWHPKNQRNVIDSGTIANPVSTAQSVNDTILTNDGAGGAATYNLPGCVAGYEWFFFAEEAQTITINPDDADVIHLLGDTTGLTAGDSIISDGTASSNIRIVCHDTTHIWVHSQVGVWVDNN